MNGWTKYFADGSSLTGSDQDVSRRIVSWRNSRTSGIVQVDLRHDDYLLSLYGAGEFWQSDVYESQFPGPDTICIKRRIACKIQPHDKYIRVATRPDSAYLTAAVNRKSVVGKHVKVPRSWWNQWLVLEYNVRTKSSNYFISEGKP